MICKSAKALLVLFLLSFLVSEVRTEAELAVTGTCPNCTLSCSFNTSCMVVSGGNFSKQLCTKFSCSNSSAYYKFGITLCSKDHAEVTCQNSLCYYQKNRTSACFPQTPSYYCATPKTFSQTCSTSCSTSPCQTCRKFQSNSGIDQYCLDYGCSLFIDRTTRIQSCPSGKDQDGKNCSCCMNYAYEPHRLCLSNLTNDTQFANYAKIYLTNNSTSNSTSSGSWESIVRIWVAVAVAFVAALAF